LNLSWIMTILPVDKTIQMNVFLGLFFLLLTGLYFFLKRR
jgi:hypothetical protein